jgi:sec-independent protein translocase protein TatA
MAQPFFLISMPSGSEWIIILIVVLLVFGGRKIPELMRGLGKGIKEFKDAKEGESNTEEKKEK